jgi:hypothetical protein
MWANNSCGEALNVSGTQGIYDKNENYAYFT